MKYYFLRLNSPRVDFVKTMTDAEKALMQEHSAYLSGLMRAGKVAAYGAVEDPKGAFGMGLMQLNDDEDPRALLDQDPTIKANAGFRYDALPMPQLRIVQVDKLKE